MVSFELTLFDDASVREKLTVMHPLEAVFDDERNDIPDEYYDIVDISPGDTIRITVEKVRRGDGDKDTH